MGSVQRGKLLRVAQIWRGEVMAEQVFPGGSDITIGDHKRSTFITPSNLGLPRRFTLLKPTSRGYVLTLSEGMSGKLSLGGKTQGVVDFLQQGAGEADRVDGAAGGFRAIPIGHGDWGIIHLDGDGDHTFFFQFTAPEPLLPRAGWRDSELLAPAAVFALVLHGILLTLTFVFMNQRAGLKIVGGNDVLMGYLVSRPPPPPEPPKEEKKPMELMAGVDDGDKTAQPASTAGREGKAGGKGDKPRLRVPDEGHPPSSHDAKVRAAMQNVGVLKQRATLAAVIGRGTSDSLSAKLSDLHGEYNAGGVGTGKGSGTGVGDFEDGTGTLTRCTTGDCKGEGGGGKAHHDIVTQNAIKTGDGRVPKGVPGGGSAVEHAVFTGGKAQTDEGSGLTPDQVLKVVMQHRPAIQQCFDKELQRFPNLSGKVVLNWRIDAAGPVLSTRVKSSTLGNLDVESCLTRQIGKWRFPVAANGQQTIVNFPFLFQKR